MGRFEARVGIYDSHNQLVGNIEREETTIDDEEVVEKIYLLVEKIIKENNLDGERIFGVGVAMPGLVDEETGINYTIKKKALQNVKKRIEEKFQRMEYVNNDARMQAYGEFIW